MISIIGRGEGTPIKYNGTQLRQGSAQIHAGLSPGLLLQQSVRLVRAALRNIRTARDILQSDR